MEDEGWLKLHRKARHSAVWKNQNLWRFWTWCLLNAAYKPTTELVRYTEVGLQPGQLIFGRRMAQKETGLSETTVMTCVKALSTGKNPAIKHEPYRTHSIITILNWPTYQEKKMTGTPQLGHNPTTSTPPPHHSPAGCDGETSPYSPRAGAPAKLVVEETKENKNIYSSTFEFLSQEWLRHTGFPSLSPNDNKAAEKWTGDIVAEMFPQDMVAPVIKNALADPNLKSRDLWCVFNNRNKYLPKKSAPNTEARFVTVGWKCDVCGEERWEKWRKDSCPSSMMAMACTRDRCEGRMMPLGD